MLIDPAVLRPVELAEHERERLALRAVHTVSFGLLGTRAVVHFGDAPTARLFSARYREMRSPARGTVHAFAVCDERGLPHFWEAGKSAAYVWDRGRIGPGPMAFLADAIATHALLTKIPARASLHAAALAWRNGAFALAGPSTAGKSTTALACVAEGCELYSDERCVIADGGVVPYGRTSNVRAGAIDLLLDDLPAGAPLAERLEPHRGADWSDVPFEALFGAAPRPSRAPLRALFAIVSRAGAPRSRRIGAVEMLPLAASGAKTRSDGIDRLAALLAVLQSVRCYELVLGPPRATARHLIERFDEALR